MRISSLLLTDKDCAADEVNTTSFSPGAIREV
jgi:hypothetical protein